MSCYLSAYSVPHHQVVFLFAIFPLKIIRDSFVSLLSVRIISLFVDVRDLVGSSNSHIAGVLGLDTSTRPGSELC